MKKKKTKIKKDIHVFKKRLKLNKINKRIVNHLTRNSKAVYNTTLYYSKKIFNKDDEFLNQYNETINKYKNVPHNTFSQNGICMYISKWYDNYKFMANHCSQQTIKKVCNAIKAFFKLRKNGNHKAQFPKYLDKNARYGVCFTKNIFKKIKYGNKYFIRLTLGKYIQNHFLDIIKSPKYTSIDNKKYYSKNKVINKSILKCIKVGKNRYVRKKYILNGMYLNCAIPEHIYNKDIIEIEIKPVYNGLYYELIVKYELPQVEIPNTIHNPISIDLGLNNLLTVFGLKINPFIISGRKLKSINQFYNKIISKLNKKRDKLLKKNKKQKVFQIHKI